MSLLLIISGALKSLFIIQMSYNASVASFFSYFNPEASLLTALLIITIILTGIIYSLAVRLVILVGYKIANRIYLGKVMPIAAAERPRVIDYVEFKVIAIGYITLAGFVSALLNIPMYLFPLSLTLCQIISIYIEMAALIVMAFDLIKRFEPIFCKRAITALLVPFGVFLVLRVLVGL